jgi:hypothetical protein
MIYNMVNEYPLPVTPKFRGGSILTTPSSRAAGLRKAMDALPMAGCLLASSMTAEAGQPLRTQLGGTIRTVHDADALPGIAKYQIRRQQATAPRILFICTGAVHDLFCLRIANVRSSSTKLSVLINQRIRRVYHGIETNSQREKVGVIFLKMLHIEDPFPN